MAEITQASIESAIASIDTAIQSLVGNFPGGITAAALTDYRVGQIDVKASQQLEQLIKAREMYQALYEKIPSVYNDRVSYDIDVTGRDRSDDLGDE